MEAVQPINDAQLVVEPQPIDIQPVVESQPIVDRQPVAENFPRYMSPHTSLYSSSIQLLNEMGWNNEAKNRDLLGKHQGDVSEVIRELLDMH